MNGIDQRGSLVPASAASLLDIRPDDVAEDRWFSVGIDAGTSGIRVAAHDEFHAHTTLFDFGPNHAGGTRFSLPAVAAIQGDALVFGNDAVDARPADRFVSFKGAMVHAAAQERLCVQWASLGLPASQELTPGWTDVGF